MIKPNSPPKIYRDPYPVIEEFLMFCVAVAGKNARVMRHSMHDFVRHNTAWPARPPLESIWKEYQNCTDDWFIDGLALTLKIYGVGCNTQKARTFVELAKAIYQDGLNIILCSVEDLEKIWGIGKKTSRFFVSYSRDEENHAILDTHILRWLRHIGYEDIPKSTPQGKRYDLLESTFLGEADLRGLSAKQLDRIIWTNRNNPDHPIWRNEQ